MLSCWTHFLSQPSWWKKNQKPKGKKRKKYGEFERNEGLRKNATDVKQKRIIHVYEPAWNQPIPFLFNGSGNYKTI